MTAPAPAHRLGRRAAILLHTGLGDTLMVVPLVKAIRALAPEVELACTAHPLAREVLKLTGTDVRIIAWPGESEKSMASAARGVLALRAFRPDSLVVPPGLNLRKASWAARASGARYVLTALADHDERTQELRFFERGAFTEVVPRARGVHKCDVTLGLLPRMGLPARAWSPSVPRNAPLEAACRERLGAATGLVPQQGQVLGLHLGCTPALEAKLYPPGRLLALAAQFCEAHGTTGLVFWGGGEEAAVRAALDSLPAPRRIVAVPWRASLAETSALLSLCKVVLGSDSGIMHLAAARGQRVLALFGPTNPGYCGPYGGDSLVLWNRTKCAPCYARPEFYDCPYGRPCMNELSEATILGGLAQLWDDAPGVTERERPAGLRIVQGT